MKSMTDFIMEQEAPQVVEESFNENELVSNFMGVCAASANLTCVLECANIVEFCNANDIAVPSIIQEGWADFWTGFKNFFKRIADWFKSLVKGTTAVFAKNKLTSLIAKLRTFDKEELVADADKILPLMIGARFIIEVLDKFRADVCEKIIEKHGDMDSADAANGGKALYDAIKEAEDTAAGIKDLNKWFSSTGELNGTGERAALVLKVCGVSSTDQLKTIKSDISLADIKANNKTYNIAALIQDLEAINEMNIPSQGEKILKQFDVTVEKLDVSFSHKEGTGKNTTTKTDKTASQVQKVVKEAADAIAKFYDKLKSNMIKLTDLAYKHAEVAPDKKKEYDKELERANKDTGRKDLHTGDKLL